MVEVAFAGYVSFVALFLAALLVSHLMQKILPITSDGNRNETIDGVRGFLALGVVAHHFLIGWELARTGTPALPDNHLYENVGPDAVMVFFMITAFLFYGNVIRNEGRIRWLDLYLKRIFRLTPLYLVLVTIGVLMALAAYHWQIVVPLGSFYISVLDWIFFSLPESPDINNSFPVVFGVVWTLRYEWAFYLLLPVLALLTRFSSPKATARIAVLACLAVALAILPSRTIVGFTSRQAIGFPLGGLIWELTKYKSLKTIMSAQWFAIPVIICFSLALFLPPIGPLRAVLAALGFLPIAQGNSVFGLLRSEAARRLGDASYGIYILHGAFIVFFFSNGGGMLPSETLTWFILPVIAAIVSAVSICSYRYFELWWINKSRAICALMGHRQSRQAGMTDTLGV